MNTERYRAYLDVVTTLAAAPLAEDDIEQLRDIAEGLLLSRGPASLRDLMLDAELALVGLSRSGQLGKADAAALQSQLRACGPQQDPLMASPTRDDPRPGGPRTRVGRSARQ